MRRNLNEQVRIREQLDAHFPLSGQLYFCFQIDFSEEVTIF